MRVEVDGGVESGQVPRPPRRVPGGDGSQTVIEGRSAGAVTTQAGSTVRPRPPWRYGRFFGGLLVLLLVLGAGGGAGWLVRERTVHLDTKELQKTLGPAVVRVVATTCGGSGAGTGVLIGNGLVLTAASVVEKSLSAAVVSDGRLRRANPLGTSADGVAVLQVLGRLDGVEPVALADRDPKAIAPRAQLGYTEKGELKIQPIRSAKNPRPLSEVINPAKIGGPVVDRDGRLIGLVTGTGVADSKIVPLGKLREYASGQPPAITPVPVNGCEVSRGPQAQVTPELNAARTPLALEAQELLSNFMTLSNRRDFTGIRQYYSRKFQAGYSIEKDRLGHQTSFFFGPRLIEVTQVGERVIARMTVVVLYSSTSPGSKGQNCSRLDQQYELVREDGKLKYDRTRSLGDPQSCDTD